MKKKGLERDTIDKFYTKRSVVKQCIYYIKNHIQFNEDDIIVEPSAGDGAFIKKIKSLSNNYIFYDISPDNEEIIKQDFLKLDYSKIVEKYNKIHIIGNPPFGRQSSLAIKFIKKCCEFANSISFILPKSFKKDSMKKHFPLNYHLIFENDLQMDSFLLNDKDTDVPCVFQIWKFKKEKRKVPKKIMPIDFKFVKKTEEPDISFRRVGVYAGKISCDYEDKSIQSHYFIKFTNGESLNNNNKKIKNASFSHNNTVGPKSISKQELIKEFNGALLN